MTRTFHEFKFFKLRYVYTYIKGIENITPHIFSYKKSIIVKITSYIKFINLFDSSFTISSIIRNIIKGMTSLLSSLT